MKRMDISRETHDLLIEQARQMPQYPTQAETILWRYLRKERLDGFKFRRQQIIQTFIVDFYCPAAKLVIEVNGAVHQDQVEYDQVREDYLHGAGYHVIRFTNDEILEDLELVLDVILQELHSFKK